MSLINRILRPGGKRGWVALSVAHDGMFAVSMHPPHEVGGKPSVDSCVALEETGLDAKTLQKLSRKLSNGSSSWTVPLHHKAYGIYVIEEPLVRPEEMDQSVRWAVGPMVDFPISDACVAWMRIPTEKLLPNRPRHIYVMVSRNEVVEEYRRIFKEANLHLGAIDVQETGQRNIAALLAKPGEGVALLTVTRRAVQLTITFQGELYLDRSVDELVLSDGADEATIERACERVVLQVQRSLDFIGRTLPFIDINRVVMAPLPGNSPLPARIAENLSVSVEMADMGSIFDLSRVPQLQRSPVDQANYLPALGAALRFMDGVA